MHEWKILTTPQFEKDAKKLSKRYISLKYDLAELAKSLLKNPNQGTSLGNQIYKIRLSIKSKGKGKSGGARLITWVINLENIIYLLALYDKSEIDAISDKELKKIVSDLKQNR